MACDFRRPFRFRYELSNEAEFLFRCRVVRRNEESFKVHRKISSFDFKMEMKTEKEKRWFEGKDKKLGEDGQEPHGN